MKIYEIGIDGYWTGNISDTFSNLGSPANWTRTPVPILEQDRFALWTGEWTITSQAPTERPSTVLQESVNDIFVVNSASNFIHTQRVIAQTALKGQTV